LRRRTLTVIATEASEAETPIRECIRRAETALSGIALRRSALSTNVSSESVLRRNVSNASVSKGNASNGNAWRENASTENVENVNAREIALGHRSETESAIEKESETETTAESGLVIAIASEIVDGVRKAESLRRSRAENARESANTIGDTETIGDCRDRDRLSEKSGNAAMSMTRTDSRAHRLARA